MVISFADVMPRQNESVHLKPLSVQQLPQGGGHGFKKIENKKVFEVSPRGMPVTAVIFIIAAASACGIAPTGAFFSKELVYEAAKQSGNNVFFIIAEIGSFITLLTFIKVGHALP